MTSSWAPRHHHSGRRVQSAGGFVRDNSFQFGAPGVAGNLHEAERCVEGHIPTWCSKRRQCQPTEATCAGPRAEFPHHGRPDPPSAVPRMHIDLLEMGGIGRQHLNVREPYWFVLHRRDPQPTRRRRRAEHRGRGRLAKDGFRRVPYEQARSRKLDVSEKVDVLRSGELNDVVLDHRDVMPGALDGLPARSRPALRRPAPHFSRRAHHGSLSQTNSASCVENRSVP